LLSPIAELSVGSAALLLGCVLVRSITWLIALRFSLRDSKPDERASILRALGPYPSMFGSTRKADDPQPPLEPTNEPPTRQA
jgi:hypothetical protein